MKREEIKDKVYKYLIALFADIIDIKVKLSTYPNNGEDLQLYYELELDSLDMLTFIIELEKEFNISIPDDIVSDKCTPRDIIDYIYNKQ